jgi:hypothetical protein
VPVFKARLGPALTFYDRQCEPLPIRSPEIELHRVEGQVTEVRLTFRVDPLVWRRIDTDALFHLGAEARGPTFAGGFLEGVDFELEVRLARSSMPMLTLRAEDEFEAGALLVAGGPGEELLATESWYALYVKQPRGPIKTGFQTIYAP